MLSSIPSASAKGFQNASSYDKHRPSYPPEVVTRFLKHLQVSGVREARIVDLAAGTGKFTEVLAGREEDFEILAVEPHVGAFLCARSLRIYIQTWVPKAVPCGSSLVAPVYCLGLSFDSRRYHEKEVLTRKIWLRHEGRTGEEAIDGCESCRRRG